MIRWPIILALPLFVLPPSAPGRWKLFHDQRVVSDSGRRYVVIRDSDPGITFELCQRRPGAPAMQPATMESPLLAPVPVEKDESEIARDPKDILLASGNVGQIPLEVRVLDQLGGFVLFEQYYRVGYGKAVIYVNDKGEVVVEKTVQEIFGRIPEKTRFTTSSIWWCQGFRVDEQRKCVVVISKDDTIREISLIDGKVSTPGISHMIGWFGKGTIEERVLMLEVASRLEETELTLASSEALVLAWNPQESLPIRVRAAVIAVRAKAAVGRDFAKLFEHARGEDVPRLGRDYAILHLPEILGVEAMPILRELMRSSARRDVWTPAQQGFANLGAKALPILCEMLLEQDATPEYRGGAADVLGRIGSKEEFEILLEVTKTADQYTANAAVNAAIRIGAPDLSARLIEILDQGSTQDDRIALYFKSRPTPDAIPALKKARDRFAPVPTDRRWIMEAIEACEKSG